MNDPAYLFESQFYDANSEQPVLAVYRFESISPIKTVQKYIVFSLIEEELTANLALVDELDDGTISDSITTNNGDMNVVLSTVVKSIAHFLSYNPIFGVMRSSTNLLVQHYS